MNEVAARGRTGSCTAAGGLSPALVSALRERPSASRDPGEEVDGPPVDHPLVPVLPLLHDTLAAVADEVGHPVVVTDVLGRVLWTRAARGVRVRAGHVAGGRHAPTPAARPVHDPDTGEVVAVVDLAGPVRTQHPTTLALVAAVARLAGAHLAVRRAVSDARRLLAPSGRP